ncbi:MAG: SufE family protein [Flavobacteriales bacterium]|nr:SufE family protein [Flavobacteriales bacterium]
MTIAQAQQEVVDEFALFNDWQDRYEHLIELGKDLPLIAPEKKTEENIVRGCQSRVWLNAEHKNGLVHFTADSDAMITKGLIALLVRVLNDRTPKRSWTHRSPSSIPSACASMMDQMKRLPSLLLQNRPTQRDGGDAGPDGNFGVRCVLAYSSRS